MIAKIIRMDVPPRTRVTWWPSRRLEGNFPTNQEIASKTKFRSWICWGIAWILLCMNPADLKAFASGKSGDLPHGGSAYLSSNYLNEHENHAHRPQHGGVFVKMGRYHVELVLMRKGDMATVELYILNNDEHTPRPLANHALKLRITFQGHKAEVLALQAAPLPGEGGSVSRFRGEVKIPKGTRSAKALLRLIINNKKYRTKFKINLKS